MSRRRKILIAVGILLVVAILISVIHHYQLRAATGAYIAELKTKGEPMDLAQVIPPPVPPEQNSAETFREAATLFEADQSLLTTNTYSAMKMVAPGKALICSQQPDIRGYDATNSRPEVMAAVTQNAKSFALLQQIIDKPEFDFHIRYDRGFDDFDFTNLNLAPIKSAAMRLETAALCNLHQGDTVAAEKDLRTMLALVEAARDERFVISELVRMAIVPLAMDVNWEILQSTNLTDEQLAGLQHDWADLDFIRAVENALAMERVTGEITLTQWRSSSSEFQRNLSSGKAVREQLGMPDQEPSIWDRTKMTTQIFLWHYWWSYPDELRSLKGYEVLLATVRFAETNGSFQDALSAQDAALDRLGILKLNNSLDSLLSGNPDFHSMLSESIVTLSGVTRKVMRIEAAKQVVITAIALKRYQLKHGAYPADLTALVPEFVPSVPRDPVDGQALRYRLNTDDTFLLYSVGENGKDDGGDPSLEKGVTASTYYWQSPHTLDWVWPQPATPEEIQNFYEHPPK